MKERLETAKSFILTGASGAGKSSVARGIEAITDGPYKFERAKAVVTRKRRGPEDDDYTFVTDDQYDALKRAGKFVLETPSYNYRGAVLPYTPPDPRTYPMYTLTPLNAQRLQGLLAPRPRIVHVDRLAASAIEALLTERPSMSQDDIATRLGQGASDRITAREIENIGVDNDSDLPHTVLLLYEMLVADVERYRQSTES